MIPMTPQTYIYYGPYAWASQHSLSENMYINLYNFLSSGHTLSRVLKHGTFYIFHVLIDSLRVAYTRELLNAAYALLLPA